MLIPWEKKLDILGPIEQAARCLDTWLKRENRSLTPNQKQRAAALMARYFHYEEEVTDQLIFSFLDHYSGKAAVDFEDPTSVRMEIKAVLDQSRPREKKELRFYVLAAMLLMLSAVGGWDLAHKKITDEQQAELKSLVQQVAELDPRTTTAAVWSGVKTPLNVRRYQDISWWRYPQSRGILEQRLKALSLSQTP